MSPVLDISNFPFSLGKEVLWGVFALFAIVYVTISIILLYHWRRYGMNNKNIIFAEGLFFLVSIGLFAVAAITLKSF